MDAMIVAQGLVGGSPDGEYLLRRERPRKSSGSPWKWSPVVPKTFVPP